VAPEWISKKRSTRTAGIIGALIGAVILATTVGVTAWGVASNRVSRSSLASPPTKR